MTEPAVPARAAAPRSLQRSLASIVLGFEIFVVFLAALAIWGLAVDDEMPFGLPRWSILVVGGVAVLLTVVTIGLLRYRWAYWIGWGIQVLILASGVLNPAMFIVGLVFGGMWAYCMVVGARIDRNRAAHDAAGKETA